MFAGTNKTDKPWFKEWFDSPYYRLLYSERDEAEARKFINNLLKYLPLAGDGRILDLACGNGRHSVYLAELGYQVVGVDIAENQIKQAKPYENENLSFYKHDMRKPLNLGYFDVLLNLFTSFGYFELDEEHEQVIRNVEKSLKSGGWFLIDFLNVYKAVNNLRPHEIIHKSGCTFHINRYLENGFIKKDILVEDENKNLHFKEKVRALTLHNFEEYLKGTNFTVQKIFGDYNLNGFDPHKSERLIIAAQKNDHA